jgi:hypothetical protein
MAPLILAGLQLAMKNAPEIVQYFTGSESAANVAAKVVEVAQVVTGAPTAAAASAILAADPVKALEFRQKLLEQETELAKAQLADRADARAMQVAALAQGDQFSKRFIYYFAAAWSLFAMFYMVLITVWPPMTDAGKANSATILGFLLGTAVATIIAFFFGSTDGGKEKSKLLAMLQPTK